LIDKKYHLHSYKVGVNDAILDSLKGVKKAKFDGGGITDYDWANEFRKGKPNKMVVVYRIDGNLMISEVEVEARNETEAYYNTRKQFEAQNPNAKIEKVYTLGDVEAGKFEEGGGVNVGKYIVTAYDGKSAEFSLNKKGLKAKNETDVAYFNLDQANRFIEKHKSKYLNVSKHLIRERTFNDDVADYDDFVDRETYLKLKQQGRKFNVM
jgi:hypothetical protein